MDQEQEGTLCYFKYFSLTESSLQPYLLTMEGLEQEISKRCSKGWHRISRGAKREGSREASEPLKGLQESWREIPHQELP